MQMRWIGLWITVVALIAATGCSSPFQSAQRNPYRVAESASISRRPANQPVTASAGAGGNHPSAAPQNNLAPSKPELIPGSVRTVSAEIAEPAGQARPTEVPNNLVPRFESESGQDTVSGMKPESPTQSPSTLMLDDVLRSVYGSYPLLRVAVEQRSVADGQLLESQGDFDLKLKGGGSSGALGFYQTNRYGAGFEQAMFGGGEVFAGYRIGRGNFQPWYGERQTNDGGEFMAGFLVPLLQNKNIDSRRANIFRAALGREAVEPEIFMQLIDFVQTASYSYWDWVAAGQGVAIELSLLEIALQRQNGLQKRADRGDLPRIELTDNERLIAIRRAALIDAQRKYLQTAIKLSLFFRTEDGQPLAPRPESLPDSFPEPVLYSSEQLATDIQLAIDSRPEVSYLFRVQQQMEIDLAQARNQYLPELNVGAIGSQDVGGAASSTRDKSPFELETSMVMSVPLQRRKALGRMQSAEARLAQTRSKIQFAREKIATEVEFAVAAMIAASQRIDQARQSVRLNETMETAERRRFDQGDSNLLMVNLREQATADARKTLVTSMLEYHEAAADFQAALASVPVPN